MAWVLLVLAIAAEVVGTLSLKASDGFSRLWPSVAVVAGYGVAFTLLAFALKTLDVGPAYALWAGLGTVGAAVGGWLIFSERLSLLTVSGIVIVVIGVVAITMGETRT
jgi:small multidrug resistance pump